MAKRVNSRKDRPNLVFSFEFREWAKRNGYEQILSDMIQLHGQYSAWRGENGKTVDLSHRPRTTLVELLEKARDRAARLEEAIRIKDEQEV